MARVKNTMKLVEKSIGCIDAKYDMSIANILDIQKSSMCTYDLIVNGFRFGYMQGLKASESKMQKGGAMNV